MTAVLLDTHAWVWSLQGNPRLSPRAIAAIADVDTVLVSAISFFEIAQKVGQGKWREMLPLVEQLPELLRAQGGSVADFAPELCIEAGILDWVHRDPFDRLLAATARRHDVPLVSADAIFDGIVTRIW
ncbi:MAG: type II toxin-antitoxin system VapC family toxin [Gluconacetobacter diazotrophicus]|nr:type II toxin-antitoxin system VapC family toxin [Gluconacetobacter diazotrophicus]